MRLQSATPKRPEKKWAQAVPATRAAPKLGRAGHDPPPRARGVIVPAIA